MEGFTTVFTLHLDALLFSAKLLFTSQVVIPIFKFILYNETATHSLLLSFVSSYLLDIIYIYCVYIYIFTYIVLRTILFYIYLFILYSEIYYCVYIDIFDNTFHDKIYYFMNKYIFIKLTINIRFN